MFHLQASRALFHPLCCHFCSLYTQQVKNANLLVFSQIFQLFSLYSSSNALQFVCPAGLIMMISTWIPVMAMLVASVDGGRSGKCYFQKSILNARDKDNCSRVSDFYLLKDVFQNQKLQSLYSYRQERNNLVTFEVSSIRCQYLERLDISHKEQSTIISGL